MDRRKWVQWQVPLRILSPTLPGAVGYVTPGVLIEVVDESDNPLPLGKEGLLRIRSPHNIKGYFGNPEETKNAFRDGCFYPGDLGYLTRDGMLVVSGGRHKTRLNLGGAENSAVHTLLERD